MREAVGLDERARAGLTEAVSLAAKWHGTQLRKGTPIPYLSHLLQVAGLVLEHGGSVAAAIAGLLHDSLEDAESPEERAEREATIQRVFGPSVLDIVLACTDTGADEAAGAKRAWRPRKEAYLQSLQAKTGPSVLVAACDKRHNLGALVNDVRAHGRGYLDSFNAGADEQLWFFEQFIEASRGKGWPRLDHQLDQLLTEFRELLTKRD